MSFLLDWFALEAISVVFVGLVCSRSNQCRFLVWFALEAISVVFCWIGLYWFTLEVISLVFCWIGLL